MESKSSYTFKNIVSTTLILFLCVFCSFSFSVSAAELDKGFEFNLNYAEPCTSDNQGYITLLTRDNDGVYGIFTYFWNTIASANGTSSPSYAYLTIESTSFTFNIGGSSGSSSAYYSLTQIDNVGYWWNIKNSSSESYTVDLSSHGRTILGWHYKGNVGHCNGFNTTPFTVYFNSDASSILLRDVWDLIHSTYYQNEEMISELETLYSLQSNRLSQVVSWLETLNGNTTLIDSKLSTLIQRGNDILEEEKKQTTFLERIWNSIQEFFNPDSEDKETTDKFKDDTEEQSNAIDDLNEQNKVERPDADSLSDSVDANLDMSNTADYSGVLAVITNNEYVLQMILISLSLVVVAYILFGKRD